VSDVDRGRWVSQGGAERAAGCVRAIAAAILSDQLARLCRRGSTKVPSYLQAEGYAGEPIPVEGPREGELVPLAKHDGLNPRPLLTVRDVFDSLADTPDFVRDLHVASEALRAGPRETIETWLTVRGVRR
jgi:fructuronate reductase/mannitol 2-dehydrogenase